MPIQTFGNSSEYLNYPVVNPTLDLNFALTKTLDPRITFTRASTGTYTGLDGLIKTAAVNEPRFDHNPTTGESLGLLVEESRTNLLVRSEEFDSGSWIPTSGGTGSSPIVTANYGTAPNGTITADRIQFALNGGTTTSDISSIRQPVTVVLGTTYSASFWARSTDGISSYNVQFRDDIASIFGSVIKITGSWQRFTFPSGTAGSTNCNFRWWLRGIQGTSDSADILIWGAQLEQGSFPTSYIPTTSATVTRSADVASITGANFTRWYRQDEGAIYCQALATAGTGSSYLYSISDGTNSNFIYAFTSSTASAIRPLYVTTGGVAQVAIAPTSSLGSVKISSAYKVDDFAASLNGGAASIDTSGSIPIVNRLNLAASGTGGGSSSGTLSRLTYWPKRLSNDQLRLLTQ